MNKKNESQELVPCSVSNCQKLVKKEEALEIEGMYFCKSCGVAYYRTVLNL